MHVHLSNKAWARLLICSPSWNTQPYHLTIFAVILGWEGG